MATKPFILNDDNKKLLESLHTKLFKKYGESFYEKYVESSVCIKTDDPSKVLLNVTFTYDQDTKKEKVFEELKTDIKKILKSINLLDYFDDVVMVDKYSPRSHW